MVDILAYGSHIALAFRIMSCIILLGYCIPLQIREAGVKNGLRKLRLELLLFGLILLFTNVTTMHFLVDQFIHNIVPTKISIRLQLINAFSFLCLSGIGYAIYSTQYTEESKQLHEKIEAAKRR